MLVELHKMHNEQKEGSQVLEAFKAICLFVPESKDDYDLFALLFNR